MLRSFVLLGHLNICCYIAMNLAAVATILHKAGAVKRQRAFKRICFVHVYNIIILFQFCTRLLHLDPPLFSPFILTFEHVCLSPYGNLYGFILNPSLAKINAGGLKASDVERLSSVLDITSSQLHLLTDMLDTEIVLHKADEQALAQLIERLNDVGTQESLGFAQTARQAVAAWPPPPPPPPLASMGGGDGFSNGGYTPGDVTPILVIACNRISVTRALNKLIQYRPSKEQFPIIVSQDCGHEPTATAILEYSDRGVELVRQPDLSVPKLERPQDQQWVGYYKIARHFKFALG